MSAPWAPIPSNLDPPRKAGTARLRTNRVRDFLGARNLRPAAPGNASHWRSRGTSNAGHISWPLDIGDVRSLIDRYPVGFRHDLSNIDLFNFDSLADLATRYADCQPDYFVAAGAPTPGTPFYSVAHGEYRPHEALEILDARQCRVLLKRPENHDPRFRDLLDSIREEVGVLLDGDGLRRIMRTESAIFVSSAATVTPLHFDPEVAFFSQIEGEKIYHVYRPSTVDEEELERFYVGGVINIGQVEMSRRLAADEQVFALGPGRGFHQPQNAPHWVETCGSRSISYTVVFETDAGRALGRTRACNHYMRRLRLQPARPGARPAFDALKSGTMRLVIPLRRAIRRALSRHARR
jgi:hypothetical protein